MQANVKAFHLYVGTAFLTFMLGVGFVTLWTTLLSQSTAQYDDLTRKVNCPMPHGQSPNSPIRNIDFENFTYPGKPIFGERKRTFTLHDGELPAERDRNGRPLDIGLSGGVAVYYDVTGDGIEDAIVVFHEDNHGGTAIVSAAYIYTLQRGRPVFLWGFEAGDRADGGLRSIYGQNGELIIELKGKHKVIGKDLYASDDTSMGACCSSVFTRTRYRWNGRRFVQRGDSEVLPLSKTNY